MANRNRWIDPRKDLDALNVNERRGFVSAEDAASQRVELLEKIANAVGVPLHQLRKPWKDRGNG